MSIGDATGDITHSYKDISEVLENSKKEIEGIVGEASFGGFFGSSGEPFAGMDVANLPTFYAAMDTYINSTKGIIDVFNPDPDMEKALKGDVATATHEFLVSAKKLMNNYVATLEVEKKEAEEAGQNWEAAAGSISGDITGDSDSIRSQADSVDIQ